MASVQTIRVEKDSRQKDAMLFVWINVFTLYLRMPYFFAGGQGALKRLKFYERMGFVLKVHNPMTSSSSSLNVSGGVKAKKRGSQFSAEWDPVLPAAQADLGTF